jgi:glycine hydroxymethyltransferase
MLLDADTCCAARCCRAVQIAKDVASSTPAPAKLKEFKAHLESQKGSRQDVAALRAEVEALASSFPMPGL